MNKIDNNVEGDECMCVLNEICKLVENVAISFSRGS